jgi:hypothetical protein
MAVANEFAEGYRLPVETDLLLGYVSREVSPSAWRTCIYIDAAKLLPRNP